MGRDVFPEIYLSVGYQNIYFGAIFAQPEYLGCKINFERFGPFVLLWHGRMSSVRGNHALICVRYGQYGNCFRTDPPLAASWQLVWMSHLAQLITDNS